MRIFSNLLSLALIIMFSATSYLSIESNQAVEDMNAKDWTHAKQELVRATAILPYIQLFHPDYARGIHYNFAMTLLNLGEYEAARKELEVAEKCSDAPNELLELKGDINVACGDLGDGIANYRAYVKKFPNGPLAVQTRNQIGLMESEFEQEAPLAKHSNLDSEDYFNYATHQYTIKWKKSKFPLTVYIPSDAMSEHVFGYTPQFSKLLRSSFEDWQKRTNNLVSFRFVDKAAGADIACHWADDPKKLDKIGEAGDTRTSVTAEGIRHADIHILTKLPAHEAGKDLADVVHLTSLHEIGHSLGLEGHSPNPKDIMFFTELPGDSKKSLTERDLKTLEQLYRSDVPIRITSHGAAAGHHGKQ